MLAGGKAAGSDTRAVGVGVEEGDGQKVSCLLRQC